MQTVSIKNLRVNPAQMRTRCQAEELARLALQVRGGIDPALRLLVTPRDGHFYVVSGHRRWLAYMVALLAGQESSLAADAETALDQMLQIVKDRCQVDEDGFILLSPALYEEFAGNIDGEVPVELWEGSEAEEVMTLIRANAGAEEADLLGQAAAFQVAVGRGVTVAELAQATGMPEGMVEAIMAIPSLPEVLQDAINNDQVGLESVPGIVKLPKYKRAALAQALKAHMKDSHMSTFTGAVDIACLYLQDEPEPPDRRRVPPQEYNQAYILRGIWDEVKQKSPQGLWQAVARRALQGYGTLTWHFLREMLANLQQSAEYFNKSQSWDIRLEWDKVAEFLPDDVTCETCIYATLPDQRLRNEFDVPCRERGGKKPEAGRCVYGAPADGPFCIPTPWGWQKSRKETKSAQALLKAWKEQQAYEAQETARVGGAVQDDQAPIEVQRGEIQDFMDRHAKAPFWTAHPWATACERCKYHREDSPVKSDPDAPHCDWAKGIHTLNFNALVPCEGTIVPEILKVIPEGQGLVPMSEWPGLDTGEIPFIIPSCMQFAPVEPWTALIPESPVPSPWSREVLVNMVDALVRRINHDVYSVYGRAALQFLTGRPEKASGDHRRSFKRRFQKVQEELTDLQLWTLVQWLQLEFLRVGQAKFRNQMVPLGTGCCVECNIMAFYGALRLLDDK